MGCGEKMSDPLEPGGCTAPLVTPSVSDMGNKVLVGVGGMTTWTSWLSAGEGSLGTDIGGGSTFSRSFSWDSPSNRCFSLGTDGSAGLLEVEG